ncbi:PadR family transcriptional regulator [Glycomyces algeriensis]|uniref:PadR family transcriptional regulator n=1 Tax=Glycomyces algeriensis TaxID=256037 RepID=A0A9W6LGG6_9ACTN|nr:PadR family transcriptional regulator [Glycomyces algeriensis]MDA1366251.1 PadR family transcriptional regulator [Glycomyces algeriensis]MDR7348981.1 DNA-binding PadR family transcriptional regulator [Glycomyces algeriensis]GLI41684.1 PadR family transcriptional regulator [Glycomyces algeriensis]
MWSTRLLVLGLVRWLGPVHGYLVRRELDTWRMPGKAEIGAGSIYHALKKLTADGQLEVVATESVDARPARTTYQITARGEAEFQRTLREKLWDVAGGEDPFSTAWSFAQVLTPAENIALLHQRAEVLFSRIEQVTALLAATTPDFVPGDEGAFVPAHARAMMKRQIDLWITDAEWCEETAARMETGDLVIGPELDAEHAAYWREAIKGDRFLDNARDRQALIDELTGADRNGDDG